MLNQMTAIGKKSIIECAGARYKPFQSYEIRTFIVNENLFFYDLFCS